MTIALARKIAAQDMGHTREELRRVVGGLVGEVDRLAKEVNINIHAAAAEAGHADELQADTVRLKMHLQSMQRAAKANRDSAEKAEAEALHWKANHANLKSRLAFVTQRPDLPVDRIPAYEKLYTENCQLESDYCNASSACNRVADERDRCKEVLQQVEDSGLIQGFNWREAVGVAQS